MITLQRTTAAAVGACLVVLLSVLSPVVSVAQSEGSEETVDGYLAQLLSDDPESHEQALLGLIAMGEPTAERLEQIAGNTELPSRVRAGAVFALGRITAPSSQAVLEALWGQGFESLGGALAIQIAVGLSEYGEFAALEQIVGTGDEVLGAKAAIQLGLHRAASSLELLQEAFVSEQYARLRIFFAIALGLLGDETGRELLASAITTPELRNHCAIALSSLGSAGDVYFELGFALSDTDPLVRLRALEGLVALERSDLEEKLAEATADRDRRVRTEAERALQRLQRRERRRR